MWLFAPAPGCFALVGDAVAGARAGEVCNETSFVVEVAKAWRTQKA
jgi:hypothetical protein